MQPLVKERKKRKNNRKMTKKLKKKYFCKTKLRRYLSSLEALVKHYI